MPFGGILEMRTILGWCLMIGAGGATAMISPTAAFAREAAQDQQSYLRASTLYAMSASQAALLRGLDEKMMRQRAEITERDTALRAATLALRARKVENAAAVAEVGRLRSAVTALKEAALSDAARRDSVFAAELSYLREKIDKVLETPAGRAAAEQISLGNVGEAERMLDELNAGRAEARRKANEKKLLVADAEDERGSAELLHDRRPIATMIARYESIVSKDPTVHWDWIRLADLYSAAGQSADAVAASRKAVTLAQSADERWQAVDALVDAFTGAGQNAEAIEAIEAVMRSPEQAAAFGGDTPKTLRNRVRLSLLTATLMDDRDPKRAEALREGARCDLKQLAERDPGLIDNDWISDVIETYRSGSKEADRSDPVLLRQGIDALRARLSTAGEAGKDILVVALWSLAAELPTEAPAADVLALLDEAIKLSPSTPEGNALHQLQRAQLLGTRARALADLGRDAEAAKARADSRQIFEALGKRTDLGQGEIALLAISRLADKLYQDGDSYEKRRQDSDQEIQRIRQMIEKDPDNRQLRQLLVAALQMQRLVQPEEPASSPLPAPSSPSRVSAHHLYCEQSGAVPTPALESWRGRVFQTNRPETDEPEFRETIDQLRTAVAETPLNREIRNMLALQLISGASLFGRGPDEQRLAAADAASREAIEIAGALNREDPSNIRFKKTLALALDKRARVLEVRKIPSAAVLEQSLAIHREIFTRTGAAEDRKYLVISLQAYADALELQGDARAPEATRLAMEEMRAQLTGNPGDRDTIRDLDEQLRRLQEKARQANDHVRTVELIEERVRIQRRQLDIPGSSRDAADASFERYELANRLEDLGEAQGLAGNDAAMMSAYEEAVTLALPTSSDAGRTSFFVHYWSIITKHGDALRQRGRRAEADRLAHAALTVMREARARDRAAVPADDWASYLSGTAYDIGEDPNAAAILLQEAAKVIQSEIISCRPSSFALLELSALTGHRGDMLSRAGRDADARPAWRESLGYADELGRRVRRGQIVDRFEEIARQFSNAARYHETLGNPSGAIMALADRAAVQRKRHAIRLEGGIASPSAARLEISHERRETAESIRFALADSLRDLGSAELGHSAPGRGAKALTESRDHYRAIVETVRKTTEPRPMEQLQYEALLQSRIGQVEALLGNHQSAEQVLREAMAIRRTVANANADDWVLGLEAAWSAVDLAKFLDLTGSPERALEVLRTVVGEIRTMRSRFKAAGVQLAYVEELRRLGDMLHRLNRHDELRQTWTAFDNFCQQLDPGLAAEDKDIAAHCAETATLKARWIP